MPAVSVIVLGYNGRKHVDACLTSLLDQDFDRPYEVVFVDNGSRDGTADAAGVYENVRVHRLDRNYGYCRGNNLGAEQARAPVLVFLNQDVVVHRSWLRELFETIESDASIKAGHANIIHPWNPEYAAKELRASVASAYTGELSSLGFIEYKEVPVRERAVDTLFLSGVSIILKREVEDEIGGYIFDPDMFLYGEDMDLALRIRSAGYRTVVATRAVVYHSHVLQDSLTPASFLKTVRIIRNRLLAFWKCSDWLEFLPLAGITLFGAPFNSTQFGLPLGKKLLYFLLLIPPTVVAGIAAAVAMPRYAGRRRALLATRRTRRGWLLRTLLFDRSRLAAPAIAERA
jgi:GT2 family glycosyltransferase